MTMKKADKAFADICRKYGLKKGEGTFDLYYCYKDSMGSIDQYKYDMEGDWDYYLFESVGRLMTAKLIKLFDTDLDIEVTTKKNGKIVDKVVVPNSFESIRDDLFFFLNDELTKISMDKYRLVGIADVRDIIHGEYKYKKHSTYGFGYSFTPYTDEELNKIIEFEERQIKEWKSVKGRAEGNVPMLGEFVYKYLMCEEIFGDEEHPKMKPTDMFNLIGDLLVQAGVLKAISPQNAMNWNWEESTRSERRNIVRGWLNAYKTARKNNGLPMDDEYGFYPSSLPMPDELKKHFDLLEEIGKMIIADLKAEFEKLKF